MPQPSERKDGLYYGGISCVKDRHGFITIKAPSLAGSDELLAVYLSLLPGRCRPETRVAFQKVRADIFQFMTLGGVISDSGGLLLPDIRQIQLDPVLSQQLEKDGVVSTRVMEANKQLKRNLYPEVGGICTHEQINFYSFNLAGRLSLSKNGDGTCKFILDNGENNFSQERLEKPFTQCIHTYMMHPWIPLKVENPVKTFVNQTISEIVFWSGKGK